MAVQTASAWTAHSNEEEVGATAAEELSRWLARALAEERRVLRSALERSHQECRDALDGELGRRHGELVARLQEARDARRAPGRLPALPRDPRALGRGASEDELDGQALGRGAASANASAGAPACVMASVRAQQELATPPRASAETANSADATGPSARGGALKGAILVPERSKFGRGIVEPELSQSTTTQSKSPKETSSLATSHVSAVTAEDVQRRITGLLWNGKESQQSRKGSWSQFVDGTRFEMAMGVIIMLNCLQMAFEVQYSGLKLGFDIGYGEYAKNPNPWPGAGYILNVLSIAFGVIFAFEVSIKICALRSKFFYLHWNVFDLIVVLFWVVEMSAAFKEHLQNTTALRLARLARLLRLTRVVRQIRNFDALFLMTTAISSSLIVLAWSCMLLLMIQVLVAFTINQLLDQFYFPGDHPQNEVEEVFEYFGSFSRALLSTFEMTLANWPPVCRLLMENVSEWFMVLCLAHKLTVGFAVLGVINGVFIQETFRVAAQDDFIMCHQKDAATRIHLNKMSRLFKAGDVSGDGLLDKPEFMQLMQNVEVVTWLSSMGLDAGDENALFEYLDKDEDGNVNAEELIKGVSCLKGTARSLDLIMCLNRVDELHQAFREIHPGKLEQDRSRGLLFTSRWGPTLPAEPADGTVCSARSA